jgi:hypothetical protein
VCLDALRMPWCRTRRGVSFKIHEMEQLY